MARKCCVRNCELDGNEVRAAGLPLHRLPKDPILRSKWLFNGGFEPDYKPNTGQFICHRHFRKTDYERVKGSRHKFNLKKGSIPSIFDNYNDHPDPIIMPITMGNKSTSYPQEDLDLIKSEIEKTNEDKNKNSNIENSSPINEDEKTSDKKIENDEKNSETELIVDNSSVNNTSVNNDCASTKTLSDVSQSADGDDSKNLEDHKKDDNIDNNTTNIIENNVNSNNSDNSNNDVSSASTEIKNNNNNNDNVNNNVVDDNTKTTTSESSEKIDTIDDEIGTGSCETPATPSEIIFNEINAATNGNIVVASGTIKSGRSGGGSGRSSKMVNKSGLKFFPGARLEAKDFNEKWYAARVVETDWVEREVLIHFDKWSSRFDEWIPMDSSRLRVLQLSKSSDQTWIRPTQDTKMREFAVGERILATWADGRKYPAQVNAVLGNDKYDVLFDDGYRKIVRSSKISKIAATTRKGLQKSMEQEAYIGSKQERRDKKRKHTVMELFQHKKRTKNDGEKSKKDENNITNSETTENTITEVSETTTELNNSVANSDQLTDDSGSQYQKKFTDFVKKSLNTTNNDDDDDDPGPEWIDGEPQGTESFVVDGNDGIRRSIIIYDKRLTPEWQKHFIQRKSGNSAGKWDVVFLHKISGKKFRTKNDLKTYFESQGQHDFDIDNFDFCVHRRKKSKAKLKAEAAAAEAQKKIKTILPKNKTAAAAANNNNNNNNNNNLANESLLLTPTTPSSASASQTVSQIAASTPNAEDNAVFIGGLRVEMEDSAYKCPKDGCSKTFRKENLLQMHIKHYHPEFSKYLGSTPNVADLAYARTIGESIIDVTPRKSMNNYTDKNPRFDRKKISQDKLAAQQLNNSFDASSPLPANVNAENHVGDHVNGLKDDNKLDNSSLLDPNGILDGDDDVAKKTENSVAGAMSPGSLFDLKIKDEKNQTGIKTLLPVRSSFATDNGKFGDKFKSMDDNARLEKNKGQRKRQLSEYSSDTSVKSKKRHTVKEHVDDYADLDESTLDTEGSVTYVYRYSRRKSDENSQSSQLNDSLTGKSGTSKMKDGIDHEDGEGVMMMINGELVKVEQLRREEIINCTCGFMEEDGLMIQCDLCLCWQHGHCNAIEREKDVPEKYICYICRHPFRQRYTKKYIHDQDWIKEGKLPSLSKRTKNPSAINKRMAMLKRSYDLVGALLEIQQILHSLRIKINVAQKKDHPKLYLWAKHWEKSDIPKPQLDPISVMEVVKIEPKNFENTIDIKSDDKTDTKTQIKDELVETEPINSDTELMKILEEDNSMVIDDTKDVKKVEPNVDTDHEKISSSSVDEKPKEIIKEEEEKEENAKEKNDEAEKTVEDEPKVVKNEDADKMEEDKVEEKIVDDEKSEKESDKTVVDEKIVEKVEEDEKKSLTTNTEIETEKTIETSTTEMESTTIEITTKQEPSVPLQQQQQQQQQQPVIPEPEAPIDPAECRSRLLEHIEHFQGHIDSRLTTIEAQVRGLESMDPDDASQFMDVDLRTKETIKMLLRDLNTIRKLASLC